MMPLRLLIANLFRSLLILVALGPVALADHVLDNVPRETLALTFIRDLKAVDAELHKLLPAELLAWTPLATLRTAIGPDAGLREDGDILLAVLSGEAPLGETPLCAWLPVSDYGRFAQALGGDPNQRVTVVTIFGEDLLCARAGRWALVMDPDQRPRMARMLTNEPDPPPQLAASRDWLTKQDAALVVLPTLESRNALRSWANVPRRSIDRSQNTFEELFSSGSEEGEDEPLVPALRRAMSLYLTLSPELTRMALSADAAAIGARLDDTGDVVAGLRMTWQQADDGGGVSGGDAVFTSSAVQPPSFHSAGPFAISGSGRVPRELLLPASEAYVKNSFAQWRRELNRQEFSADSIEQFAKFCQQAAADVLASAVYLPLGREGEGAYTNQFLAVRVTSADAFVDRVDNAMRQWNAMNNPTPGLIFASRQVKIDDRPGTQYSLDIAAADGLSDIPEIRQVMEQFFGPDGKMHLFVVTLDEKNVLLAAATPDQVAAVLPSVAGPPERGGNDPGVSAVSRLLPQSTDWRLFVNPSEYSIWRKRRIEAERGQIFGAPEIRLLPASPPIGLAGGFGEQELWVDIVVPSDAKRAIAEYLRTK